MRKLLARRDDQNLAVFVRQVDLAVSRNRRRTETVANDGQALAIEFSAGLQVVSIKNAAVVEHVKSAFVDQRRRHVRAAASATPDDRVAACLAVGQREVAARASFDDEDRTLWSTSTRDHDHVVSENRRRRGELRA